VVTAPLPPASVEALGDIGDGMSTEVWWSPAHPFKSSLTSESAAQVASQYESATGRQWTQPIGFVHALFEVAAAALKATANVDDKQALANAIKGVDLDTVVGKISWSGGPVPNVAKTPLVGGQWRKSDGERYPFKLVIVSNKDHPEIPKTGSLEPIPYS
jgi:branched-chain amino acid transport system substrate-binding protein